MAPRFIARQLAFPKGVLGRAIGHLMNLHNSRLNAFAIGHVAIRPPQKILEIGFGGGLAISRLIDMPLRFSGIDRSEEMVLQASSRFRKAIDGGKADFRVGNVEHLPFEAASFSNVFSMNTVYFWKSLEAGFGEIHRVLVPGGQAIIGFLPKEYMARMNMPADIFTLRTMDDVVSATRNAGFSETNVERPGSDAQWRLVLARK